VIQLVEVFNAVSSANHGTSKFSLREVYINPKHVVAIRPDTHMSRLLAEGRLPEDLDPNQAFTKLYIDRGQNGLDLVVVGSVSVIGDKLGTHKKSLLRG
jgi:hypothetical protein